jgi:hypothetical protein
MALHLRHGTRHVNAVTFLLQSALDDMDQRFLVVGDEHLQS